MIHQQWCDRTQHAVDDDGTPPQDAGTCTSAPVYFGRPRERYGGGRPALWLVDDDGTVRIRSDIPSDLTLKELWELADSIAALRKMTE